MNYDACSGKRQGLYLGGLTASPSINGCRRPGSKRVYNWLPNAAAETSNPLPTLPWAKQCTNCARLCARFLPRLGPSVKSPGVITETCRSKDVTKDVMSAADDPRPVLCTSASCTPCGLNGGILDREEMVRERFNEASCMASLRTMAIIYMIHTDLRSLGIEVVISSDHNIQTLG